MGRRYGQTVTDIIEERVNRLSAEFRAEISALEERVLELEQFIDDSGNDVEAAPRFQRPDQKEGYYFAYHDRNRNSDWLVIRGADWMRKDLKSAIDRSDAFDVTVIMEDIGANGWEKKLIMRGNRPLGDKLRIISAQSDAREFRAVREILNIIPGTPFMRKNVKVRLIVDTGFLDFYRMIQSGHYELPTTYLARKSRG